LWNQDNHIQLAANEAGLDLARMEKLITHSDQMDEIERNHEVFRISLALGSPINGCLGRIFFAQDRIETLEWRLEKLGLRKNTLTNNKNRGV